MPERKQRNIALKIQVWCVHRLIALKILPNVWHKCELELAKREAKQLCKLFGGPMAAIDREVIEAKVRSFRAQEMAKLMAGKKLSPEAQEIYDVSFETGVFQYTWAIERALESAHAEGLRPGERVMHLEMLDKKDNYVMQLLEVDGSMAKVSLAECEEEQQVVECSLDGLFSERVFTTALMVASESGCEGGS